MELLLAKNQSIMPTDIPVKTIQTAGLTVSNADRLAHFYTEALGFAVVSEMTVEGAAYDYLTGVFSASIRIVTLQLGGSLVRLMEYLSPSGRPLPVDSKASDRWFQHLAIVVSDMDRAYGQVLPYLESSTSAAPQTMYPPDTVKPDPAQAVQAFKFKDPDGHDLELIHYPPGKGSDRWHQPTDRLFLGIDHSAITITDTAASLQFYRDLLGLQVSQVSTNAIAAQERLDGLFSAKAQITRLDTASPQSWGIELLEYQTPPGGRPFPVDHRSNDLMQVQLELVVDDVMALFERLETAGVQFVSPKVVTLPDSDGLFHQGALVRDPDGHSVLLIQP
jgi:catechol 2,3-dioxygenase-like lactoylglutathione lyase family enzyme